MPRGDSKKRIPQFYVLDRVVHILYFQRKAFLSLFEHVFTGFPFGLICTDPRLLNSLEINKCIRLDSNFFWVECLLFLHLFFLEDRDSGTNLENKRKPIPDPRAGTALVYISAFLVFYFFLTFIPRAATLITSNFTECSTAKYEHSKHEKKGAYHHKVRLKI